MTNSRAEAGKMQKPGTSFCARKQRSFQKLKEIYQKDTEPSLKKFPLVKSGTVWASE